MATRFHNVISLPILLLLLIPVSAYSFSRALRCIPPPVQGEEFYGWVFINGAPANNGTSVVAYNNGTKADSVFTSGNKYDVFVDVVLDQQCGIVYGMVTFLVSNLKADQTVPWSGGGIMALNLTAGRIQPLSALPPPQLAFSLSFTLLLVFVVRRRGIRPKPNLQWLGLAIKRHFASFKTGISHIMPPSSCHPDNTTHNHRI